MVLVSTSQNDKGVSSSIGNLLDVSVPTLTPDTDISSDSDTPVKRKIPSKARAKKARKVLQQTLSAAQPREASLRPAKDVLSRIRHDPALDNDNFIVGYQDRHADVMELPVTLWKGSGDVTEEDFIPQHRILYFRRKDDGIRVWDRKERVDLLFGSGHGDGDGQKGKEIEKYSLQSEKLDGETGDAGTGTEDTAGKAEQDRLKYGRGAKAEGAATEYEDTVTNLLM